MENPSNNHQIINSNDETNSTLLINAVVSSIIANVLNENEVKVTIKRGRGRPRKIIDPDEVIKPKRAYVRKIKNDDEVIVPKVVVIDPFTGKIRRGPTPKIRNPDLTDEENAEIFRLQKAKSKYHSQYNYMINRLKNDDEFRKRQLALKTKKYHSNEEYRKQRQDASRECQRKLREAAKLLKEINSKVEDVK